MLGGRSRRWQSLSPDVSRLVATYPRVFHSASVLAWPSIKQHASLSTQRLLDLHDVSLHKQHELLTQRRSESVGLVAPDLPPAVIRGQKPLKVLEEKIEPGGSVENFLMAINSRVFFWPSLERLERLRHATEYRNLEQVIFHVDTRCLSSGTKAKSNRAGLTVEQLPSATARCEVANLGLRSAATPILITDAGKAELGPLLIPVLDAVPDVLDIVVDSEHIHPVLVRANARPGSRGGAS